MKKSSVLPIVEHKLKNFWNKIVYMMFPDDIKCIFCGRDVPNFYDKPYCEDCEKTLSFNNGHRCKTCDMPSESDVCDFCKKEPKYFKRAFCPFIYEKQVKNLVLAFKESNKRYLAKGFAVLIAKRILESGVKIDKITYIPMTEKKQKKRGFNQAKLLADEVGKILNKPVLCLFKKEKDMAEQKVLNYKDRKAAIIGTYSVKEVRLKKEENILIVDDIITTTATINYCAGLIYPQVNNIYVCGVARTQYTEKTSH